MPGVDFWICWENEVDMWLFLEEADGVTVVGIEDVDDGFRFRRHSRKGLNLRVGKW